MAQQSAGLGPAPHPDETDPEDLLGLLEDRHTQAILAAIQTNAKPARALANECEVSRATVYRRLNSLEDAGLVESTMTYDADGHHRTVFEATLDGFSVTIGVDGISVSVSTTQSCDQTVPETHLSND